MKTTRMLILLLGIWLLAACTARTDVTEELPTPSPVNTAPHQGITFSQTAYWVEEQPRLDNQGAVSVEIRPLNLNNPGATLDFAVALNTHSVDLSMDLSQMAVLTTDTGAQVQATRWDAPRGGHHVRGTLHFPAAVDGLPVIQPDTHRITITIQNLDVPERTFVWER